MGLFNKLKEILFDEETVEIPVITKEDKREEIKKEKKREVEVTHENTTNTRRNDDEVIIEKIDSSISKRSEKSRDRDFIKHEEDLFDMPKLKAEPPKEIKVDHTEISKKPAKTFTFPVFEDENQSIVDKKKERRTEIDTTTSPKRVKEPSTPKKPSGYTNAYDYSYGKYKGDYKANRENNQNILKTTLETKETRKEFKPSPIISPVYGVLNENYKKEDIVSKSEKKEPKERVLDLDSVRRKAYGTLEDEIELSLTKTQELEVQEEEKPTYVEEGGLSINDLLVDQDENSETDYGEVRDDDLVISEVGDSEIFDVLDDSTEEIEIDDIVEREPELDNQPSMKEKEEKTNVRRQIKNPRTYSDDVRDEVKEKKSEDTNEPLGEEDLFDLIDSLYQGKGEE